PPAALLQHGAAASLREHIVLHASELQTAAWPRLIDTVRTGMPAFDVTYRVNIYDYLSGSPSDAESFDNAMTSISQVDDAEIHAVYDFSSYHMVIDVGGGRGYFLASMLTAHPSLQGILFEVPTVASGSMAFLESQGLMGRCQVLEGDFTVEIPRGGDLYIFKRVFTSETDQRANLALNNCREAMNRQGKLLMIEPDLGSAYGGLYDILMLAMTGGKLRSQEEYQELLVGSGFGISQEVHTNSYLNLIEAAPI
ncbi:MAG: methyltransferase, partial [Dehalococcoidia bacterium]